MGDLRAVLTGSGALAATVHEDPPPPTALTGQGTLGGTAVASRTGGSTSTVLVSPEGLGTKVLAGSTSTVLVTALGQGVRVQPYATHPNARPDSGFLPAALASLATHRLNRTEPERAVPRPTISRQTWSSDVPISRPAPAPSEPQVDLGGFAFGATGIMLPVVDEDVEAMAVPTHEEA